MTDMEAAFAHFKTLTEEADRTGILFVSFSDNITNTVHFRAIKVSALDLRHNVDTDEDERWFVAVTIHDADGNLVTYNRSIYGHTFHTEATIRAAIEADTNALISGDTP